MSKLVELIDEAPSHLGAEHLIWLADFAKEKGMSDDEAVAFLRRIIQVVDDAKDYGYERGFVDADRH